MGTRTTGRARVTRPLASFRYASFFLKPMPVFLLRFSAPPHAGYCSVASPSTFENHLFSLERLLSANGEKKPGVFICFLSRWVGWLSK